MGTVICDKNGIPQEFLNGLWWSRNFDRFWQLLGGDFPVLICYGERNLTKFVVRGYTTFSYSRIKMKAAFEEYNYRFLDPETQQVYPENI